jgi:osmoprotectant transport system permease protein
VIGTATLSTPIGQTSLGNYIFSGLQTQNWVFVVFGCVAVALLALGVDQLLALMQMGLARRKRRYVGLGAVGLLALTLGGLAPGLARPQAAYVIGAKTFTEQYVLAALLQQRLAAAGLTSRVRSGLGSNVLFDALASGEIDVAVDYSGTLWTNRMHRTDVPSRAAVLDELGRWLMQTHGIRLVGALGFENAYALAMPRAKAEALNVHTLAELARVAPQLTIASDYEFFARPEWRALRNAYGLKFGAERTMQPEFMYRAAASGEVDVISAYTSDGQIAQYDMVVLDDPKHVIPPYDAVLLVSARRAQDEKMIGALKPLIDAIPVSAMREANAKTAGGMSVEETARRLEKQIKRE